MSEDRIEVSVKLVANLRKYGEHRSKVKLPKGNTAYDLLQEFEIPEEEEIAVMVNGQPKYMEYELEDDDSIDFMRSQEE